VELTVVSGGRARSVKVTTVKASALKDEGARSFTIFRSPDAAMAPMPPMPPMSWTVPAPPKAPAAPRAPMMRHYTTDGDEAEVRIHLDEARKEMERVMKTEMPRVREEMERVMKSELPKVRLETQRALEEARKQLQETRVHLRTVRTVRI
jgi:SpoVK/Ycf46/Vps4 family AAA+-type ATPase